MTAHERHTITRAICRQADGSRTDGKKGLQLPFPVMRFDVNFPTADHPEVASDADSFTGLFLTYYCKALSRAFIIIKDFHKHEVLSTESKERLVIEYSIRFSSKNRAFIPFENKYPVVQKARELASSRLNPLLWLQKYELIFNKQIIATKNAQFRLYNGQILRIMTAHERHTITRAICRQADGSRTDGKKGLQLPLPVMRFDVNFPTADHPEVASDADSFTGLFLTYYCKALSGARFCKSYFHLNEILECESKERLVIEYSIRLDKNRTSTQKEINVLLYFVHESLPPLELHNFYIGKYRH